ncbi:hypothetical protein GETHOR_29060 [Geothrix oryzae]|uniref:DUF2971 domain-containing protein n=1 Tax=Geothrix oryzae TaxID=2927975 RepID=A0ABN6VAI1_9BACT|nr:DUF2971 domain-containing protein [Geothrix oryzae]BDU70805.1 hypothetical protein GETHOR_29060 [Geothrix oryzae]
MIFPEIKYLYKYMPFTTNTVTALVNKKFWCSKPENFNDPLDCGLRLLSVMSKAAFILANEDLLRLARERKNEKAVRVLSKLLRELKHSKIQPDELINYLAEKRSAGYAKELQEIGILSLSEVNDNILMWSHYAEQHHGLCVEFLRSEGNDLAINEKTLPIRYSIKKPEIAVDELVLGDDSLKKEIRRSLIYTKSNDWSYEREWRLIVEKGNIAADINSQITSIIFGFKMPIPQRITLYNILKNGASIKFKEAILKPDNFGLDIVPIDPEKYLHPEPPVDTPTKARTTPTKISKLATKRSIPTKTTKPPMRSKK